jgi:hypothetical protein
MNINHGYFNAWNLLNAQMIAEEITKLEDLKDTNSLLPLVLFPIQGITL